MGVNLEAQKIATTELQFDRHNPRLIEFSIDQNTTEKMAYRSKRSGRKQKSRLSPI